jgi:CO/xanthine dehydrogenase FAD-binding subunit
VIAADFEYHRPDTLEEATEAFRSLEAAGKAPLYYGGGTEILTRLRQGELAPGALIDLKAIPEMRVCDRRGDELWLGAGLTLAELCARNPWPLLSAASGRVADHTTRCQITLGGNLAGTIPYREAVLPFLLTDARALVAGPEGQRTARLGDVFAGSLRLGPGEFLVQVAVAQATTHLPHAVTKRTRLDFVDYPLVTLALLDDGDAIRLAASGMVTTGPWRLPALEAIVSERRRPAMERARRAVDALPADIVEDIHATAGYRRFVFGCALADMLGALGG